MHGLRRRFGIAVSAAGLLTFGLGFIASPTFAAPKDDSALGGCPGVWNGTPEGSLTISAVPAAGTAVHPGDQIIVTASWDIDEWVGETLHKVDACVTVDGDPQGDLSDLEKPSGNDAGYEHTFSVPAGAGQVCVRVGAHGDPAGSNPSTQKSNTACWDVEAAQTTGGGNTETTGGRNHNGSGNSIGSTDTQVEGVSQTQTGGNSSTGTLGSEVHGISGDAVTTPTGSAPAATDASGSQATTADPSALSGTALPSTSGAISPEALAATGSATQALVMLAGLVLLLGGLAITFSAPRRGLA